VRESRHVREGKVRVAPAPHGAHKVKHEVVVYLQR
jgi:hypothetical protein